jgi:hypothetical protein
MPTAISAPRIANTIATIRAVVMAFLLKSLAYVNLPHALLEFSLSSRCRVVTFYTSIAAWPRLLSADFLKMISSGMTASIAIINSL